MACRSRKNKHAAVDYHEWAPRSAEPQDPNPPHRVQMEPPTRQRYDIVPPTGREPFDPPGSGTYSPIPDPYHPDGYPPADSYEDFPDWAAPTSRHGYVEPAPHGFPTQSRPFTGSRPYDNESEQRPSRRDDFGDTAARDDPSLARNITPRPGVQPSVTAHVPLRDGFDGQGRDYPAVLWWTAIWYAVPVLAYTIWTFTLSGSPGSGCTAVNGDPCASPRSGALADITHNLLGVAIAIAISVTVAVWIRRISLSWRAISVGFAAVVVGSGAATIVMTL